MPDGGENVNDERAPTCLVLTPSLLEFGEVSAGCTSAFRSINLYNTCTEPIILHAVEVNPSSEFSLSTPIASDVVIPPLPSAPVVMQVGYAPVDPGSDVGALTFRVAEPLGEAVSKLQLQGRGLERPMQTDRYTQGSRPPMDVLLVVDDSCSMADRHTALAHESANLLMQLAERGIDYHIGVTTSSQRQDCTPSGCTPSRSIASGGELHVDTPTGTRVVTPSTPNGAEVLARLVQVGTMGNEREEPLATAVLALTPPLSQNENGGFLRDDATLFLVVVSDAADASPEAVETYVSRLQAVKNLPSLVSCAAFAATDASSPSCAKDAEPGVERYEALAAAMYGEVFDICQTGFSEMFSQWAILGWRPRGQFYLNTTPDMSVPVTVTVNGTPVAPGATTWQFNSQSNSVDFADGAWPPDDSTLEVTYRSGCF